MAAALAAAREGGWRRVVCVFQPHRYSRTAALWPDFADAFGDADVLALTDVYAAGRGPPAGRLGRARGARRARRAPLERVAYLPRRTDLAGYLAGELRPGDLCLTLGAGDLTLLPDELQARLDGRPA